MIGIGRKREREFTGWHMLIVMVAFFGVIVAVNVTMAVLAGRTWTGLVVKNSYVASQHFNEGLAAARRQAARGWSSSLGYADGQLAFSLVDRDGKPVVIDGLKVWLGRPAFEQQDRRADLVYVGEGRYRAKVDLGAGPWEVAVTGGAGEQSYRSVSRLTVGKEGAGKPF
jgi:nitrogen fixation protein FixH